MKTWKTEGGIALRINLGTFVKVSGQLHFPARFAQLKIIAVTIVWQAVDRRAWFDIVAQGKFSSLAKTSLDNLAALFSTSVIRMEIICLFISVYVEPYI
jgi:hypothetical protein